MRRLALVVLLAGAVLAGLACREYDHVYACYGTRDRLAHSPLCPRVTAYFENQVNDWYHPSGDLCHEGDYFVGFDSYRQAAAAGYLNCCPLCQKMRAPNDN